MFAQARAAGRRTLKRSFSSLTAEPTHVLPADVRAGMPGAIGNTPLIRLRRLSEETGCEVSAASS
jgi:hypothetical protein